MREMESKLELEQTSKGRLETQIVRLKEVIEGLNKDNENLRSREKSSNDEVKKLSKYLREAKSQKYQQIRETLLLKISREKISDLSYLLLMKVSI